MTCIFIRREKFRPGDTQGKGHMATKAEMEVMQLQAKEHKDCQ